MINWQKRILTKNARNWYFLSQNLSRGRKIVDSKLKTKRILQKAGVPVPKVLGLLKTPEDVDKFSWEKIKGGFVIKPVSGLAGKGIWVIRKQAKWAGEWFLMDGRKVAVADLRYHCLDVLRGQFSLRSLPDSTLVEERVKIIAKLLRFTKTGAPDIRVVVFNQVPIMAMMRIPTEESGGRGNLHQGAVGLGLDMTTGITTFAVRRDRPLDKIMDLRRKKMIKVNGIKIPFWERILETAVKAQQAVPSLNFVGVDVVLDKEKGPLVLEINARPGLSIQICNRAGLRDRLKRVEGIKVRSVDHAVNIARSLFGSSFVDKVGVDKETKVVSTLEVVRLKTAVKKKRFEITARIDSGAYRSSIDKQLAKDLGLLKSDNILYYRHYRSALGKNHRRPVIGLVFWLKGKKIVTSASVTNRSHLRAKLLLGRRDLQGFVVRFDE